MFALLLKKEIGPTTLVWHEGRDNWKPLSEFEALANLLHSMPPDLPPSEPAHQVLSLPLATPWRRFSARHIDMFLLYLPVTFGGSIVLRQYVPSFADWIQQSASEMLWAIFTFPVALLVEAMIFGVVGTTPGKALLGVKVNTIRGERPSFSAYARRLAGVYRHGLAAAIPLVHLFAMSHQYGRLKRGQVAEYDQGMFSVSASPLGFWRPVAAVILVLSMLTGHVLLTQIPAFQNRQLSLGFKWTNPTTQLVAQVPVGWRHEARKNGIGQSIHYFSAPNQEITVVFANEQVLAAKTLETYGRWWILAVRAQMSLEPEGLGSVSGREIWSASGHKTDDESVPIRAVFTKSDTRFSRVLIVGSLDGEEQVVKQAVLLLVELLDTVE